MGDTSKYDERGQLNLQALDSDTQEIVNLLAEGVVKALRVTGWVWDTDSLSWVRAQQPALASDFNNIEAGVTDSYYKDIRIERSNHLVEYEGKHTSTSASTSDPNWVITKYSYTNYEVTRIQKAVGAWDNRGALF